MTVFVMLSKRHLHTKRYYSRVGYWPYCWAA